MTPDEKKLLEETAELAKQNNVILRKLRRAQLVGRLMHTLYWLVIIGLSVGAFYFIQPYIESVQDLTGQIQGTRSGIGNLLEIGL